MRQPAAAHAVSAGVVLPPFCRFRAVFASLTRGAFLVFFGSWCPTVLTAVEVLLFACSTPAHIAQAQRVKLAQQKKLRQEGGGGHAGHSRPGGAGAATPRGAGHRSAGGGGSPGRAGGGAGVGAAGEGEWEPVRLLGVEGVSDGLGGAGWCGDLLLLQKHTAVVDPNRPAECIGVTKTCGAASLAKCRDMLAEVVVPLMAAAAEENWGSCPHKEQRRVKHAVSEFCSLLDERAATYSENQRALTMPSPSIRLGMAGAGPAVAGGEEGVEGGGGESGGAGGGASQSVLLAFEQLTVEWILDMDRAMEESAHMGAVVREQDGPKAELRCWRQRVAMLGGIEKQLESHECQLVSAVLMQNQSGMLQEFKRMRTQVIEASREAKEVYRQLSTTIESFVDGLYSQEPLRVASMMASFMDALQLMTVGSQHFCKEAHREVMFKMVNHQIIHVCQTHLLETGDAWAVPAQDVVDRMRECYTLHDVFIEHAERALYEIDRHPSCIASDPIDQAALFQPLRYFIKQLEQLEDIVSSIAIFSDFKRAMASYGGGGNDGGSSASSSSSSVVSGSAMAAYFERDLHTFLGAVAEFKQALPDLLDLSAPHLQTHVLRFLEAKRAMEVGIGETLQRQLEVEHRTEEAMALLAALRSALPESMGQLVRDKFLVVVDNYEVLLNKVFKRYEKQKKNPPLPRNFPWRLVTSPGHAI